MSPVDLVGVERLLVDSHRSDTAIGHFNYAVGNARDISVMGNDCGSGAEFAIHLLQCFENHNAGF